MLHFCSVAAAAATIAAVAAPAVAASAAILRPPCHLAVIIAAAILTSDAAVAFQNLILYKSGIGTCAAISNFVLRPSHIDTELSKKKCECGF